MANKNEIRIVIKAVDQASKTIKSISDSVAKLSSAAGKGLSAAVNQQAKAAQAAARVALTDAKVATQVQRTLEVAARASANTQIAGARRLTEEQKRFNLHQRERLDTAQRVARITGEAAKIDAQVAGMNIRNQIAQQKALGQTAAAHRQAAQAAQKHGQATTTSGNNSIGVLTKMVDGWRENAVEIGAATGILVGFFATIQKGYEQAKIGAQLQRIEETGTRIAKGFGVNMAEAVRAISTASQGTITANQAIANVNRVLLLGITKDVGEMANLMEIAAFRGRAFGLSTEEAFDRITLGIGRLSTRILDDIGIVVDGETAYANWGKSIGKTADQLTEQEKRQALTNAILSEGNKLLKESGGLTDDSANAYARLETNFTNLANEMRKSLSEGLFERVAQGINGIFFGQTEVQGAVVSQLGRLKQEFLSGQITATQYRERLAALQKQLDTLVPSYGLVINANGDLIAQSKGSILVTDRLIEGNVALSDALLQNSAAAEAATLRHQSLAEAHDRVRAAAEAQRKALEDSSAAWDSLSGSVKDLTRAEVGGMLIRQMELYNASVIKSGQGIQFTEEQLDKMRVQFGLMTPAVLGFKLEALETFELLKNDADALAAAIQNIYNALNDKAALTGGRQSLGARGGKKVTDIRKKPGAGGGGGKTRADLEKDLTEKLEDIALDLANRLRDIDIDADRDREDAARSHARDLIKIEKDYQSDVEKIQRRFELDRMRALIDLDARALFEAEVARDSDIISAKKAREEKQRDEEEDYAERQRQIDLNQQREKDDARRHADDRRKDAQIDFERALRDLKGFGASQLKITEDTNRRIRNENKTSREKDYQNYVEYVGKMTSEAQKLRDALNPTKTPTKPPPGDTPSPTPPGQVPAASIRNGPIAGATVTLRVQGDGAFAQLLRSSVYDAFIDVVEA